MCVCRGWEGRCEGNVWGGRDKCVCVGDGRGGVRGMCVCVEVMCVGDDMLVYMCRGDMCVTHSPKPVIFWTHSATWFRDLLFPDIWESSRLRIRRNLSCAIVPMDLAESTVSSFFRHQSSSSNVCKASCESTSREHIMYTF